MKITIGRREVLLDSLPVPVQRVEASVDAKDGVSIRLCWDDFPPGFLRISDQEIDGTCSIVVGEGSQQRVFRVMEVR